MNLLSMKALVICFLLLYVVAIPRSCLGLHVPQGGGENTPEDYSNDDSHQDVQDCIYSCRLSWNCCIKVCNILVEAGEVEQEEMAQTHDGRVVSTGLPLDDFTKGIPPGWAPFNPHYF